MKKYFCIAYLEKQIEMSHVTSWGNVLTEIITEQEVAQRRAWSVELGYKELPATNEEEILIARWKMAEEAQKYWREQELQYRAQIVEAFYTKESGTDHAQINDTLSLKIERSETYTLVNDLAKVNAVLANFNQNQAAALVKWKPEISKRAYNDLSDKDKAFFRNILTIKPASPSVTLIDKRN